MIVAQNTSLRSAVKLKGAQLKGATFKADNFLYGRTAISDALNRAGIAVVAQPHLRRVPKAFLLCRRTDDKTNTKPSIGVILSVA